MSSKKESETSKPPASPEEEKERSRRLIDEYQDAVRELRQSRPEIEEDLAEEISGMHEGIDALAEQLKAQQKMTTASVHVHIDKKSDPPNSIRASLVKVGIPKWVAAVLAMTLGVGLSVWQACQGVHR